VRFYALLFLVACNHANCGENEAARYSRFLDEASDCRKFNDLNHAQLDVAICQVGAERWLCEGDECHVIGARIAVQRVPGDK